MSGQTVFLHAWSGDAKVARQVVAQHYPNAMILELSHRELRGAGLAAQLKALRALEGEAVVFYFRSLRDSKQTLLIQWCNLIHRCRETVTADDDGEWNTYRRRDWLVLLPKLAISSLADSIVFVAAFVFLGFWSRMARPVNAPVKREGELAYLFPFPLQPLTPGGARSHIRGVLSGLTQASVSCRIFSGTELSFGGLPSELIPARRKCFIFWESVMLSYNLKFARIVSAHLKGRSVQVLYQRHGRFSVAGAILSRRLRIPLALEYNGSELWMADNWDPTRFRTWLRLCEEFSIRQASLIAVVSDPLRDELLERGIPDTRILVNPNAVDTEFFRPGCGGDGVRTALNIGPNETMVVFVGTFGAWHGVDVLQNVIRRLFDEDPQIKLRFVLVGQGILQEEVKKALTEYTTTGQVIFTGLLPHDSIRTYLDAADILISPHVRNKDGRPFFGSPTKLFEYMSMGKAIIASRLDQLDKVLSHNETAILCTPGDTLEFTQAVRILALDSQLRARLGRRAREVAIERHTWLRNVSNLMSALDPMRTYTGSIQNAKKSADIVAS